MADVSIIFKMLGLDGVNQGLKGLGQGIADVEDKIKKSSGTINKYANDMQDLGAKLSTLVTLPLVGAAGALVKLASDASESEAYFKVALGSMADEASTWSEELSKSFGANSYAIRENVANLDDMFKKMGVGQTAAFEMSKGITQLSYDLASLLPGMSQETVFDKLQAGMRGQERALKDLNIVLDDSVIKHVAYQHGIASAGTELSAQQKVYAEYIAIMEMTKSAQGDLLGSQDSLENKFDAVGRQAKQVAQDLGSILVPIVADFTDNVVLPAIRWLGGLVDQFKALSPETQKYAIMVAGLAAGFGPLLIGLAGLVKLLTSLPSMFALVANPVGVLVAAIAGLVTAGVLLYDNWEKVKDFGVTAWSATKVYVLEAIEGMLSGLEKFTSFIPGLGTAISSARATISSMIDDEMVSYAKKKAEALTKNVSDPINSAQKDIKKSVDETNQAYKDSISVAEAAGKVARKSAEDEAKAKDLAKKATEAKKKEDEAAKRIIEETRLPLEKYIESINEVTNLFNAGKIPAENYTRKIEALTKEYESAKSSTDEFKYAQEEMQRVAQGAARTLDAVKPPAEKYNDAVEELNKQFAVGFVNADEYNKRIQQLQKEYGIASDASHTLEADTRTLWGTVNDATKDMTDNIKSAWGDMFKNVLAKGQSFKEEFKNIWDSVGKIILEKLAEIAANWAWAKIMELLSGVKSSAGGVSDAFNTLAQQFTGQPSGGPPAPGGVPGAGGPMSPWSGAGIGATIGASQNVGGNIRGSTIGGAAGGAIGSIFGPVGSLVGAEIGAQVGSFISGAISEGPTQDPVAQIRIAATPDGLVKAQETPFGWIGFDAANTNNAGQGYWQGLLQVAEFFNNVATTIMTPQELAAFKSSHKFKPYAGPVIHGNPYKEIARSLIDSGDFPTDAFRPDIDRMLNGQLLVDTVPGYATGGDFMATRPQLIMVGEQGPERVKVSPVGSPDFNGGGGSTVVFNGPVYMDEVAMDRFTRQQWQRLKYVEQRY